MTSAADTATQLERHRPALTGHCYRMLGSIGDADDAVQETLVRAWRSFDRFEGRSSLRHWLIRIATHVCLDALSARSRRFRAIELSPPGSVDDALGTRPEHDWLEPAPDAAILSDLAGDPSERAILRESVRLAFVAALQRLPPRQRAALLLMEVLGWSAAEAAETLSTSVAAIHSATQRARATLGERAAPQPDTLSPAQRALLDRYVAAFERYDVDTLASLLREDAVFSMPPHSLWLRGPGSVAAWLRGRGRECRGSRLIATAACGGPAFAQYRRELADDPGAPERWRPWALVTLELDDDRIVAWTSFLAVDVLFPRFGLPPVLTAE